MVLWEELKAINLGFAIPSGTPGVPQPLCFPGLAMPRLPKSLSRARSLLLGAVIGHNEPPLINSNRGFLDTQGKRGKGGFGWKALDREGTPDFCCQDNSRSTETPAHGRGDGSGPLQPKPCRDSMEYSWQGWTCSNVPLFLPGSSQPGDVQAREKSWPNPTSPPASGFVWCSQPLQEEVGAAGMGGFAACT